MPSIVWGKVSDFLFPLRSLISDHFLLCRHIRLRCLDDVLMTMRETNKNRDTSSNFKVLCWEIIVYTFTLLPLEECTQKDTLLVQARLLPPPEQVFPVHVILRSWVRSHTMIVWTKLEAFSEGSERRYGEVKKRGEERKRGGRQREKYSGWFLECLLSSDQIVVLEL